MTTVDIVNEGVATTDAVKLFAQHTYQYSTCDPARNAIATLPNLINHGNITVSFRTSTLGASLCTTRIRRRISIFGNPKLRQRRVSTRSLLLVNSAPYPVQGSKMSRIHSGKHCGWQTVSAIFSEEVDEVLTTNSSDSIRWCARHIKDVSAPGRDIGVSEQFSGK